MSTEMKGKFMLFKKSEIGTVGDSVGFMIGYLFKPHHPTVNYLKKGATGDLRRKFSHNFTDNKDEAEVIFDGEKAKKVIMELVERLPKDDEYQWTPVIINIKENTRKIIIES